MVHNTWLVSVKLSTVDHDTSYKHSNNLWNKNRKNCKRVKKKLVWLLQSSLIFSKMVHWNEFCYFVLQSVHQDASFKLSNVTIWRQFQYLVLACSPENIAILRLFLGHLEETRTQAGTVLVWPVPARINISLQLTWASLPFWSIKLWKFATPP